MHICRHIPKPSYLVTWFPDGVGSGSTMHAPPPPPSPSPYHATIRHPLFFSSHLSFASFLSVMGAWNAGPSYLSFLDVDASMIIKPLTRTRSYTQLRRRNGIYCRTRKMRSWNKVAIIVGLGSVNNPSVLWRMGLQTGLAHQIGVNDSV